MALDARTRRNLLACAALSLLVLLVFGRLGGAGFLTFDDPQYVLNPPVSRGLTWENLRWAFLETHFDNWHPLTWLSHMADISLFGASPGAHHLVNVAFHAANAALLLTLLEEATGDFWPSLATAALFALHPLHVQSVAWIAERKDVLSTCFALLTLLAYVRFARAGRRRDLGLALALYALALMSKPMVVSLPILMLCLDHWPLARAGSRWRLLAEKWPFALLALGTCIVTVVAQKGAIVRAVEVPFHFNALNAFVSYLRYLGRTFWPFDLAAFYPPLPQGRLPLLGLASLAALAGLTWAAFRFGKRRPWLLSGWVWYLAALLPAAGFVQVGMQSMADRYTYLPLVGVFLALSWLGAEAVRRGTVPRGLAAGLLLLLGGGLMARSWVECGYWKDDRTLFRRDLQVVGDNATAHLCLGLDALQRGAREEAVAEFRASVTCAPTVALPWFWMGEALLGLGREAEALEAFRADLNLEPDNYRAILKAVPALLRAGRLEEAVLLLRHYIELEPARLAGEPDAAAQLVGTREARMMLGLALRKLSRPEEACAAIGEAVRARPGDAGALLNLGLALREAGRRGEALERLRRCVDLAPGSALAHLELGAELRHAGLFREAAGELGRALALDPGSARARGELAGIPRNFLIGLPIVP